MPLGNILDTDAINLPVLLLKVTPIKKEIVILSPRFNRAVIGLAFDEWEANSRLVINGLDNPAFDDERDRLSMAGCKNYCSVHTD